MASDDDDETPRPTLKVVSDNPNIPAERAEREAKAAADFAREQAKHALAELAATILRTMAGSQSASYNFMRCINHYIDAHNALHKLTGRGMTLSDEKEALSLARTDYTGENEYQIRHSLIEDAFATIVQGALRLAAHHILEERPHFGGKYSTEVIEQGIRQLDEARKWRPRPTMPPSPPRAARVETVREAKAVRQRRVTLKDDPGGGKKKRWSPLESKSWRDVKKDD